MELRKVALSAGKLDLLEMMSALRLVDRMVSQLDSLMEMLVVLLVGWPVAERVASLESMTVGQMVRRSGELVRYWKGAKVL